MLIYVNRQTNTQTFQYLESAQAKILGQLKTEATLSVIYTFNIAFLALT